MKTASRQRWIRAKLSNGETYIARIVWSSSDPPFLSIREVRASSTGRIVCSDRPPFFTDAGLTMRPNFDELIDSLQQSDENDQNILMEIHSMTREQCEQLMKSEFSKDIQLEFFPERLSGDGHGCVAIMPKSCNWRRVSATDWSMLYNRMSALVSEGALTIGGDS